jgi:hypothetical protein
VLGGDVDVATHEVDEVRPLHEKLRHPRVVVVLLRDVAIRTAFVSVPRTVCGTCVENA